MSQPQHDLRWLLPNLRPSTPSLGLSGGTGPITSGPGCKPLTKKEIESLREAGMPRPNGFTGVWGGVHYYKGKVWLGPTCSVGQGNLVITERNSAGGFGIRAIGEAVR